MQRGHAPGLAAAQFGEDGAYLHIVDELGVEVWHGGEGGFEDVREEFVVVGVFEAAFLCAGDGGAQGGKEDDVVGVFLEDVFGAFLKEGHCGGGFVPCWVFATIEGTLGLGRIAWSCLYERTEDGASACLLLGEMRCSVCVQIREEEEKRNTSKYSQ